MNWELFTNLVGLGSLVVGVVTAVHMIRSSQGKRYLENMQGLAKTSELLREWGPLTGQDASESAGRTHRQMLDTLDKEKRLNAVLYLESVSRLSRPGSLTGVLLIAYACMMFVPLLNNAYLQQALSDDHSPMTVVVFGIWVAAALGLGTIGLLQTWRRLRTRKILKSMGSVDALSYEGAKRFIGEAKRIIDRKRTSNDDVRPSSPTVEFIE
ncbi:hypothetical protein [Arthrobacter mangrovi]|uniref:Uncharacterized protein n=1 Tax=Arthrobacter mangrovi TaxID=2966350 RepID=A0ABQ5MZT4_9MICC|nr:hypothetical protein [Arthrobacter mangrovi]GLB69501.1 hypothetical protein AHIS1636_39460 [Arthrobacter mangrovi]